ncbi:MAG: hypothetical protein OEZ22_06660 [Spirochaetia bacterium]|nr:hypothetical protein [Spirochaetia bacterium]
MENKRRSLAEISEMKERFRRCYFKKFKRYREKNSDKFEKIHMKMSLNLKQVLGLILKDMSKKKVMAYNSFKSEPPILEIIKDFNLEIYVPLIQGEHLRPVSIISNKEISLSNLDAIIVPGLFVTKSGYRLGRGRGYYDRLLQFYPINKTIFLCYNWQILREVPRNEKDRRVGHISTEEKWAYCRF